jgi:hypothetical protein
VLELADKCRGLALASFNLCVNLTRATKASVKKQLPNCTFGFQHLFEHLYNP